MVSSLLLVASFIDDGLVLPSDGNGHDDEVSMLMCMQPPVSNSNLHLSPDAKLGSVKGIST